MSFLKKHFDEIVKLYINQFGVTIFSLFLYTAVGMVEDPGVFLGLKITVSVISTIFYLFLTYNVIWEIGAKDKIRIDGGRMTPQKFKGGLISLFANVPNLLLALICIVFALLMILGIDWAQSVFSIFFLIIRFHTAMYMGMIQGEFPAGGGTGGLDLTDCLIESVLFFVIPLIAVVFSEFAYWMGSHEYKIFGFISSNKSQNE